MHERFLQAAIGIILEARGSPNKLVRFMRVLTEIKTFNGPS